MDVPREVGRVALEGCRIAAESVRELIGPRGEPACALQLAFGGKAEAVRGAWKQSGQSVTLALGTAHECVPQLHRACLGRSGERCQPLADPDEAALLVGEEPGCASQGLPQPGTGPREQVGGRVVLRERAAPCKGGSAAQEHRAERSLSQKGSQAARSLSDGATTRPQRPAARHSLRRESSGS
jgi:hypothetical protein